MKALVLALGLCLAVGGGVALRMNTGGDRSGQAAQAPSPVLPPEESGQQAARNELMSPTEASPEAPEAIPTTRLEWLEKHWGARWPEVRTELEAEGYRLDRLLGQEALRPWEEARELLSRRIESEFVDPEDADFRLQNFFGVGSDVGALFPELCRDALARGLTDEDLRKIVAAHDRLREVCKADYIVYRSHLATIAQQRLQSEDLLRAPFKIPRSHLPESGTRPFLLSKSFASSGWAVSLQVHEGEDQALDATWAQFLSSAEAWRNAVSAALVQ